nr:uncharacterized protein LOC133586775 [Nerophis lumbriciformis]XP_061795176.1 uncharacterized protein LOC133586775 [Nerophis lumbriciformis]XP_061795187.1 uncharacterized protein LOC133586775 [Nerophis lumbriciformis]XP_061795195.1 uncharacterized protein LOC133586775 [Nerophis lumbriciformis]XP_061795205.1 uncharacterized protein LOC133586775 [Nerophis lumbriciformis]
MDGVLDGASMLCVFKLVCSLLFLPSLATSRSPIGFCGCCILFFTDFMVTVFVSCLSLFSSWLTELSLPPDVIALRFLLFLSHTYGAVLLLTTPLLTVETLLRLLRPAAQHPSEATPGEAGEDAKAWRSRATSYACCLAVWVAVALSVQCRWRSEEVRQMACLRASGSLLRCLPNLLSPVPSAVHPCWGMAFLYLLLLLILLSSRLHGCHTLTEPHHHDECDHPLALACEEPPLLFIVGESQHPRAGVPHPGVNVTIALAAVLAAFMLPLYLGVNILLLRSVEALLDVGVRLLLFSTPPDPRGHVTLA